MTVPTADSSFAPALWRIADADVSSGNQVRLLRDGPQIFETMLAMIEGARQSVQLEMYILRDDEVGQRFSKALSDAARRGVKVRVLADWFGSYGTSRRYFAQLRSVGVEVRLFNPVGFHRWGGLVPRDHRKLLVVDEGVGLTGGIGIGVEWKRGLVLKRRSPWRETCVRIGGRAAEDMARAFEGMWDRAEGKWPTRAARQLVRAVRGPSPAGASSPGSLVGIIEGEPGRLRVGRAFHLQAAAAQERIWIASAYFVPSFAEIDALAGASRDGVDVRLLVPSTTDHPFIRRLTRGFYKRMLRNGVRVFEWRGEMMHAKTTVVDSRWVRVGSTDFNPLGVAINYELDAMIEDPHTGAEAEAMVLEDLEQSREILTG